MTLHYLTFSLNTFYLLKCAKKIRHKLSKLMGLIVHQQRYRPSDRNNNVDIKFGAHNAFLE
jgi:hypothetical protein